MATFIEATSAGGNGKLRINLDNVAWMVPTQNGTRIVFSAIASSHNGDRELLFVDVTERPAALMEADRL